MAVGHSSRPLGRRHMNRGSYPFQPQSTAEVATEHEDLSTLDYAEEHAARGSVLEWTDR